MTTLTKEILEKQVQTIKFELTYTLEALSKAQKDHMDLQEKLRRVEEKLKSTLSGKVVESKFKQHDEFTFPSLFLGEIFIVISVEDWGYVTRMRGEMHARSFLWEDETEMFPKEYSSRDECPYKTRCHHCTSRNCERSK